MADGGSGGAGTEDGGTGTGDGETGTGNGETGSGVGSGTGVYFIKSYLSLWFENLRKNWKNSRIRFKIVNFFY